MSAAPSLSAKPPTGIFGSSPSDREERLVEETLSLFNDLTNRYTKVSNLPSNLKHAALYKSGLFFVPAIADNSQDATTERIKTLMSQFLDHSNVRELPYDTKVFIGQLAPHMNPLTIVFLFISLVARQSKKIWLPHCVEPLGARGGFSGCCWIFCKTPEEREFVLALNKRMVCDTGGVWVAEGDHQPRVLDHYIIQLKMNPVQRADLGNSRLPRECIVIEKPTEDQRYAHHSYKEPQHALSAFERQVLELARVVSGSMPKQGGAHLSVRCSQHHPLRPIEAATAMAAAAVKCNFCCRQIMDARSWWACPTCDFDVCNPCYAKHVTAAEMQALNPKLLTL